MIILSFIIRPRIYFYSSDKLVAFKNKTVAPELKKKIIKDLLSKDFKNYLYSSIFNNGSNDVDDLSQYLDGEVLDISNETDSFIVNLKLFISKTLPKEYSSLSKSELLKGKELDKLITGSNIVEMIRLNIDHQYRSGGHYKEYNSGELSIDLSLTSDNDRFVMSHFKFSLCE